MVKGQAGFGETTLAPYLIVNVKLPNGALMLYYFFSQENKPSSYDVLKVVLSVLAAQIIRKKRHLVPYGFETYVEVAEQPALRLPCLLKQLLSCLPTTSIVVDGLDECSSEAQTRLYKEFEWISSGRRNKSSAGPEVKIMISSQNGRSMPSRLQKKASISLSEEKTSVSLDIKLYTNNNVIDLNDLFNEDVVEDVVPTIVTKAHGMFLLAKLVLQSVLEQESLVDVRETLRRLPSGLTGVYLMLLE